MGGKYHDMKALRVEKATEGQLLVRRIYFPRIVGMGLGFLCVAAVFYQQRSPLVFWILAVAHGIIWPHIAYIVAKKSRSAGHAERCNMLIDSFMGGMWVPLMSFNWLPSLIIIVLISMSNISVGGTSLFFKGLVGHLLGGIAAILLFGFHLQPQSTMLNIAFCIPTLIIYPILIAMIAYRLALQLNRQKNRLQETLDQVNQLSGLLPICASCKKIRDDKGYWNQIEAYIQDHSEAGFSHGICPECARKLYPEFDIDAVLDAGIESKKNNNP